MEGHQNPVTGLCYSPDNKFLASGSYDSTIRIWDLVDGREILKLEGPNFPIHCVSYSPDGNFLACGSWDSVIRVWEVKEGREI